MWRKLTDDTPGFLPRPVEVFVLVASLVLVLVFLLWPRRQR